MVLFQKRIKVHCCDSITQCTVASQVQYPFPESMYNCSELLSSSSSPVVRMRSAADSWASLSSWNIGPPSDVLMVAMLHWQCPACPSFWVSTTQNLYLKFLASCSSPPGCFPNMHKKQLLGSLSSLPGTKSNVEPTNSNTWKRTPRRRKNPIVVCCLRMHTRSFKSRNIFTNQWSKLNRLKRLWNLDLQKLAKKPKNSRYLWCHS